MRKYSIKLKGKTIVSIIGIKNENNKSRSEMGTLPPELRRAMVVED